MADGEPRNRSPSANFDDSDLESSILDGANPPGKPGRKKNPNSQAARRDQNRIAQREFRLRKQQRIRDLEARVELLSGGKDEALSEMRNILKDLMAENHTLRGLLKSLAAFIGDGTGGLLPKLGWDVSDFNNLVSRTETDTAWESYQRRKKVQQQRDETSPGGAEHHKRPAEGDLPTTSKKARVSLDGENDRPPNGFPLAMPMNNPSLGPNTIFTNAHLQDNNGILPNIMRGSAGSPMFMQPLSTNNTSSPYSVSGTSMNYQTPYVPGPGININIDPSLPTLSSTTGTSPAQRIQASVPLPAETAEEDDQNKNEAYKLITYHLDNFKRNANYCLPASLRPTLVQRTVPHESVIDRILHPELRDRMILLRGRYDLVDCLFDYRNAVIIHGDDVLAHSNWEINEKWLRQYGFLVDQVTLNVCNRWRRERGETELRLTDIAPPEQSPVS